MTEGSLNKGTQDRKVVAPVYLTQKIFKVPQRSNGKESDWQEKHVLFLTIFKKDLLLFIVLLSLLLSSYRVILSKSDEMFTREHITFNFNLQFCFIRHSPSFTSMFLHIILILEDIKKLLHMNQNRKGVIFCTEEFIGKY